MNLGRNKTRLAIEWDRAEVRLAVADVAPKQIKLRRFKRIALDADKSVDQQLEEILRSAKIRNQTAIVSVSQSQIESLNTSLPPASPNELAELVLNQATQSTEISEESVVDFYKKSGDKKSVNEVDVYAISQTFLNSIGNSLKPLRIQLATVTVRQLAMHSLLLRLAPHAIESKCLVVNRNESELDLLLNLDGELAYMRTIQLRHESTSAAELEKIISEIQRTIAVLPESTDDKRAIEQIYVFDQPGRNSATANQLSEALDLPVTVLDPLTNVVVKSSSEFDVPSATALIGLLWSDATEEVRVNFADPKKPPSKLAAVRRYVVAAVGVLFVLGLLGYFAWEEVTRAQAKANVLKKEMKDLEKSFDRLKGRLSTVSSIEKWKKSSPNLLDEFLDLHNRFPSAEEFAVGGFNYSPGRNGIGTITMSAQAKDQAAIKKFELAIRDKMHTLEINRPTQNPPSSDFGWRFDAIIKFKIREKKEFQVAWNEGVDDSSQQVKTDLENAKNDTETKDQLSQPNLNPEGDQ